MSTLQVYDNNIDHILTKKTCIQNSTIEVLGGIRVKSEKVFFTEEEVEKAEENKKSILSKLGGANEKKAKSEKNNNNISYLTTNERNLIMTLLAAHTLDDEVARPVEIGVSIAKKIFVKNDIENNYDYKEMIKSTARSLMRKQFSYFKGLEHITVPFLFEAKNITDFHDRIIKLTIHPQIAHFFISKGKGHYTSIELINVLSLKPKSQALYLILKRDRGYELSRKNYAPLYYSKAELKHFFGSKPDADFTRFKRGTLKRAIEDISLNTDIDVKFHLCKKAESETMQARLGKPAEVCFQIIVKKNTKITDEEALFGAKEEIIAKGMFLKSERKMFVMKNFKKHDVLTNVIIIKLKKTKIDENFEIHMDLGEMIKMYIKIVSAKRKELGEIQEIPI